MSGTNTQNVCPLCGGPGYHIRGCALEGRDRYFKQVASALDDAVKEREKLRGHLEKAVNALKLAYARGHFCDDVPCPGCECGYALDSILGREVSQEECERFVEEQFKVKSNER